MALFALLGILAGLRLRLVKMPAEGYRRLPSGPALRGSQTLVCPAIALFRATADAALRLRQGFAAHVIRTKIAHF